MLQQTQVKTVLERFYFQFLDKFARIEDLASASEHEVLKAWEGLGYYARARNLHKTAQLIKNTLPTSVEKLHALPGIGPSTANAIACFAFGVSVPILDGNVKRVLYRFYKTKVASDKELWVLSHRLFKQNIDYAYEHNQALMDIGSQVCTIRNPKCELCPLNEKCQGKNTPIEYPTKKIKKKKEIRHRYLIMYRNKYGNKNAFALFQNEQNLLKGLWSFKQFEELHIDDSIKFLGDIKHEYTHISLRAKVYLVQAKKKQFKNWFTQEEISEIALSKLDHKALSLYENQY
ncbi:MAG: A/G-specific adenine glycosylase [Campylobacteraceae bacterium]|nr:A/G-specific adenine glycosylase [Campylobacteraceae bacterium]